MSNQRTGAVSGAASGAASGAMVAGPWGAAVGGVIGGIGGILSGGAADDAEELAEAQAEFILQETEENLRRMRDKAAYQVGMAEATIAASNLTSSGSSERYVNKMVAEMRREQEWVRYAGKKQAELTLEGGRAASSGIMTSLFSSQASSLVTAGIAAGRDGLFAREPATLGGIDVSGWAAADMGP